MNRTMMTLILLAACGRSSGDKDDTDVTETDGQDTVSGDSDVADSDVNRDTDLGGDTDVGQDTDAPVVLPTPTRLELRGTWNADLDQPVEGADYAIRDVSWSMDSDTVRRLHPSNGTRLAAMGAHVTAPGQCASVSMTQDPISGNAPDYSDMAPDNWLCVTTSSGRLLSVHVVAIDTPDNHRLTLDLYEDPPLAAPTTTPIDLPMGDSIDVDAGGLTIVGTDGDVTLQSGSGSGALWPQNGARLHTMGTYAFDPSECTTRTLSADAIDLAGVSDGTQLCVKSSDGHYGILRLVGAYSTNGRSVEWVSRP